MMKMETKLIQYLVQRLSSVDIIALFEMLAYLFAFKVHRHWFAPNQNLYLQLSYSLFWASW